MNVTLANGAPYLRVSLVGANATDSEFNYVYVDDYAAQSIYAELIPVPATPNPEHPKQEPTRLIRWQE